MSSVFLALLLLAADPLPADAVIVAPREFFPALQPLVDHRQDAGALVRLMSELASRRSRSARRFATRPRGGKLKFVLLVGDAEPAARDRCHDRGPLRCRPTCTRRSST